MTGVLIIEDNQANMELMAYLLAVFGYAVESATSGKQGLDKAMETIPDLIICDLQMPGMDGYEVIRRLKDHAQLKHVPVVAVTAYAMVGDRDRVLAHGFEGYLSKPINSETFVQQIESFLPLEKRRTRTPALPAGESVPAAARYPGQKAAILVVDDSPINRSLIESTLAPSGYSVRSIGNVAEAMAALSENCFDLIVSDLHMNPENGLDFLQKIKADPTLSSIPFFLFSASHLEEASAERERALELGATKFLSRPVEPQTLLSVIEEFLVQPQKQQHTHRTDR